MANITLDINRSTISNRDFHLLAPGWLYKQLRAAAQAEYDSGNPDWTKIYHWMGPNAPAPWCEVPSNRVTEAISQTYVLGVDNGDDTFRDRLVNEMPGYREIVVGGVTRYFFRAAEPINATPNCGGRRILSSTAINAINQAAWVTIVGTLPEPD